MTAPTKPQPQPQPQSPSPHSSPADGSADAPHGADLHSPVIDWFDEHARDLPWRRPEAGPWG